MAERHPTPAAVNQNGTNGQYDRVVYARLEKVVKSAEFVLDVPEFDVYLRAINNQQQLHHVKNLMNFSSDFSSDGIMVTMEIREGMMGIPSVYTVRYGAGLKMDLDQVCFNLFDVSMEAFVCHDQNQTKVASVQQIDKGNQEFKIRGKQLDISASSILQKVPHGTSGVTFRVVLKIKSTIYKQSQPYANVIGADTQCEPPFLRPIRNGVDSDVQLVCEGETFPVHAIVLKNVSLVFRRMLEAPMKEAAMRKIVIEDMSADTTKRMLDYVYQGRVNVRSDAQVVDLLYAAEKYDFDLLKTACLQQMVASMTDETVTSFLEICIRVNAGDEVVKPMVAYCLNRIVELLKRQDFPAFAQAHPQLFLGNTNST